MEEFAVDLTGVSTEIEALPIGYYPAQVSGCERQMARSSGKPTVRWEYTITEPEEYAGKKAFHNTSLQPQALWNFKRTLIALGWDADELEEEITFSPEDVLGQECVLQIGNEPYEGIMRTRVERVLPADTEVGIDVGIDEIPF